MTISREASSEAENAADSQLIQPEARNRYLFWKLYHRVAPRAIIERGFLAHTHGDFLTTAGSYGGI